MNFPYLCTAFESDLWLSDMRNCLKILFLVFALMFGSLGNTSKAQFPYGTTGLLHLPTADMQRSGTVMLGGGWLNKEATPGRWYYDTWNYYLNVTLLPFFEIAYDMTLFKGSDLFKKLNINRKYYHYWANQDRNFSVRLRAIKEGQFWPWMPQVVLGGNDVLHTFSNDDVGNLGVSTTGNGYWGRLYFAATKHFVFEGVGELGAHVAFLYNDRKDFKYKGVGCGANFQVRLNQENIWSLLANGVNVMAEYDTRSLNVGLNYKIWNDHINLFTEANQFKYVSAGLMFKMWLK